ncbi:MULTISPECIES: 2-succinyl-5-enolpyruvyl-6-hydroxy-3-cyclohexene-1-carboxylic-acid synthase [unclassified Brevibacterium]|uniref:2-succinyl-5-enolpyruvyl-6-hydroxy-3- cyclohexene-1-carboxylic-acid synthase n=1 Tax=unclassified Brevibacterium TaxID=2614124 RepID=UPI001F0DD4CA|nr:2-succinyl-5-enolpyruvyl-6-hydroxy-3-cyclohexene-1-carboxylic-acid synthase [Brevibacterium sp. S22]
MSNSSAVAQQIARTLVLTGVSDVVFAPGSRSAPLVYALGPLAEAGLIRTHVRIDERDAAFLALGLARGLRARGSESAVAVVTTSGSAVANLHPAILEASYGHLPLLALTADRPARLRATGANQTIDDQSQVLSDVRARFDIPAGADPETVDRAVTAAVTVSVSQVGAADTEVAGPVQFNVQFDTPLVPTPDELRMWTDEIVEVTESEPSSKTARQAVTVASSETVAETVAEAEPTDESRPEATVTITDGTVIVAGDAGGHSAESLRGLAADHHLPMLAEPSSPLARTSRPSASSAAEHSTSVPAHARVLSDHAELREAIRTVIVHGKPTLTRPVAALIADESVTVQRMPDDIDALTLTVADETTVADDATGAGEAQGNAASGPSWVRAWIEAGTSLVAAARAERHAESDTAGPACAASAKGFPSTARAITEHLAAQDITLFVASSNSVRYLSDATDIRARIHASRGLAGIDGLVSTATGLSLGLDEPVVLLIGDIAMLHDIGGLLTPSAEDAGDVTIVVLNDDGGAIFSGLEHSQSHLEGFLDRYFTVPHGRGFAELAAAFGWDYASVESAGEFERALAGGGATDVTGSVTAAVTRRIIEVARALT